MYCKHCGKEIDDNSAFCKNCGKPQDGNFKVLFSKPVWIIYLIWVISNLYLLMGDKSGSESEHFFPFCIYGWRKEVYDFSEFIVYVFIVPAIVYVIYKRYSKTLDKFWSRIINN